MPLFLVSLTLLLSISTSLADEAETQDPAPTIKFVQLTRNQISNPEKALNYGLVYLGQWASYFITQPSIIREHGSFKNWHENMLRPHFDKDGIGYNLRNHSYAGNLYYNFYRSRGYDKKSAVFWTILSSAAFEFTIETATERPSLQDLYQTPILGSLLGMGMESASLYFHSLNCWPARILGYILNPFTIAPISHYGFRTQPIVTKQGVGAQIALEF